MDQNVVEIIERAQKGDEEAFNILYDRYYNSVYARANYLCRNDADAKDALQETFLEVHRSLKDLRDLSSFYSWLMMIVSSKCGKIFRKNKFKTTTYEGIENSMDYQEQRFYMNPEKYSDHKSEQEILMELIDSLDPKFSELIKMSYLEEMKLSEIAEVLHIPLGTVKTRSVRSKEELRKKIEAFEVREQRRLHFNVDTILPITIVSGLYFGPGFFTLLKESISKFIQNTTKAITQNLFISASVTSMILVNVAGGSMLYNQVHEQKKATILANQYNASVEKDTTKKDNPVEKDSQDSFRAVTYKDNQITNSQQAYYKCMNFAMSQEEMKLKSKEEIEELRPIYEALKQSQSKYYESLQENGWSNLFENYAE